MAGRDGLLLTVANIVAECDRNPEEVIDSIQEVIDDPAHDIPGKCVTKQDVARLQELCAYYGNWLGTLTGLWAKVRNVSARRTKDANLVAMRDILEEQRKTCWRKYETASRAITAYQEANQGQHERIF